jgi:CBS domain-containing protein
MVEKEIRRLPVLEKNKLVGIITATDLARLEPHELL